MSRDTVYAPGSDGMEQPMPKRNNTELGEFGARLVAMRKAAKYTQQELAQEIGVSRRMIAYYEGETQHPPTTILPRLAQVLGVSVDDILNDNDRKKETRPESVNTRLRRKLQIIEKLGFKEKRQAMQLLDMFIEHGQPKRQA